MSNTVQPTRAAESAVQGAGLLLRLARACRRNGLVLEFIGHPDFGRALTGADVISPTVQTVDGVTSYFLPAQWDIADALRQLPAAVRVAAGQGANL